MNNITTINSLPSQLITDEILLRCDALTLTTVCFISKKYKKLASNDKLWINLFPDLALNKNTIEEEKFFKQLSLASAGQFGLALTIKEEESAKNFVLQQKISSPGHLYKKIKQFLDKFEFGDQGKLTVNFPGLNNTKIVLEVTYPPKHWHQMYCTPKKIEESCECLINEGDFISNNSMKKISMPLRSISHYYDKLTMSVIYQNVNLDCKKIESIALKIFNNKVSILTKILNDKFNYGMMTAGLLNLMAMYYFPDSFK
jgi:hypothetical protein